MENLTPKDHAEAVALFRSEIVGALTRIDLPRGALAERLEALSQQRFRPPGATATRTFAVPTLERWYRHYKKGGLAALRPEPRSDRGAARALTAEQQDLLCDVRRERPSASAELILDTLVADGRLETDVISPSSLVEQGLGGIERGARLVRLVEADGGSRAMSVLARVDGDEDVSDHRPRAEAHRLEGAVMSLDYLSHFGLAADPFAKDIGDAELWLPPSKLSLVEDLTEAMHARASALLTGEPGVGKTCVLRALRHALAPANFRLVYCQNTTVGRRDFYRHLCLALGLAKASTAGDLFLAVSAHVEDLAKERVCPVFLVDEAHLLHQDTLDHLHILLNYQWDQKPLLSLILIGLPDLEDRLRLRRNRSLYSRIHHRFALGSLLPDDTTDYIRARLARVGATKDIFAVDALAILHEAAGSSLRDTDRLATAALRASARKKKKLVERDVLTRILQNESEDRP